MLNEYKDFYSSILKVENSINSGLTVSQLGLVDKAPSLTNAHCGQNWDPNVVAEVLNIGVF